MHQIVAYFKFLLSATNQYGVHSPFVYDYLTKCLYTRSKHKARKTEKVLFKSIGYFKVENLWIAPNNESLKEKIKKTFPLIQFKAPTYDLIYIEASSLTENIDFISDKTHNDSMILVESIHKNKQNSVSWKSCMPLEISRVTLDMFHCGAIFPRSEQVEEHFKIRI